MSYPGQIYTIFRSIVRFLLFELTSVVVEGRVSDVFLPYKNQKGYGRDVACFKTAVLLLSLIKIKILHRSNS